MSNRLIHETGPYLLPHAHHPVDWSPWGEDAFTAARETGKPIFLSIGYSTCHWCHVLSHESFEDEETARLLNERYISIKVDREERPDIDHLYMTAAQVMNGQGGWPLSVFMTAEQQPTWRIRIGTEVPVACPAPFLARLLPVRGRRDGTSYGHAIADRDA
jgi:uncharacterized protein YyaL (SSP411 family)